MTKQKKKATTNLVRVGEAKTVAKLMGSSLQQVRPLDAVDRPSLGIVKVGVTAINLDYGPSELWQRISYPTQSSLLEAVWNQIANIRNQNNYREVRMCKGAA